MLLLLVQHLMQPQDWFSSLLLHAEQARQIPPPKLSANLE